jgi:hypothetical protein
MGQLTGECALMTADARGLCLATAEGQPDDHRKSRGRPRHGRLIAFLNQRTTHSFKQSGPSRLPIGSSALVRPALPIH